MDQAKRIVIHIPLAEIWDESGTIAATRGRYLDVNDVTELLKRSSVEFIVADVGHALKRIPIKMSYDFWKSEVKTRVLNPDADTVHDRERDESGYYASEWIGQGSAPIVVLERIH